MSSPRPDPDSPAQPLDHPAHRRLPPLMRRAWYGLNQAFRRRIAHLEITPDQFTVLRWLHEDDSEGITQRSLTDLMASDPNTVTSVLTRMESSGLIERKAHETDRRAKRIRLKAKGRKVYLEARQIALDLQQHVLAVLPEGRRQQFLENLEQVADAAREAADSGMRKD